MKSVDGNVRMATMFFERDYAEELGMNGLFALFHILSASPFLFVRQHI